MVIPLRIGILVGFLAQLTNVYSFTIATHNGYYFLSLVAILLSVISATYYLKIIRIIHFELSDKEETSRLTTESNLTNVHSFTIATLTMVITLYVFKPSRILNSTTLLALQMKKRILLIH